MPIYALVDTWNASGTTFTGIGLNVTDTASAAGSLLLDLQVGGVSVFRVAKSGIARFVDRASARDLQIEVSTTGAHHRFFSSNTSAGFQFENNATVLGTFSSTTGLGIGNGSDLFLTRDAADTLAQRRGTNAQAFRIYGTYTDASNYERVFIGAGGGNFQIYTQNAGSGVAKELQFGTNNGVQWKLNSGGHFLAGADNTYDIGASGANRPRNLYVAGRAVIDTLTIGLGGQTSVATNTALGVQALHSASLTGVQTVAVGNFAGNSLTTGGSSVFVGHGAGQNVTTGTENTAVGRLSLSSATTANYNTAIGQNALLYYNTSNNTAIGQKAAQGSTTVANNTGSDLTAVGYQALASNTSGSNNSATGAYALFSNTTGSFNSATGAYALFSNTTGSFNSAVGVNALYNNTTGSSNSAVGVNALRDNTTGGNSTAAGREALERFVSTGNQVAVGYRALRGGDATPANNTGANNIGIGFQAGDAITTGSTNIVIGHNIDVDSATGSNQINIGDRYFHDRVRLLERGADPAKPAEGNMIVWMSDGTGLGDDGDVIIASTAGGVTNYAILFDHSAGTLWP
jgi:hypothetical protein